jgi:hypothetical protein
VNETPPTVVLEQHPPERKADRAERLNAKTWRAMATVRKFNPGERALGLPPVETITRLDNAVLDEGATELLQLLAGIGTPTAFSNANARVGVGNGTAAVVNTQTGLQGTSVAFAAMEPGYPAITGRTCEWQAVFPEGVADFAWEEWTLDNGASAGKNLNRRQVGFGTKSGQEWELTVTITVAA